MVTPTFCGIPKPEFCEKSYQFKNPLGPWKLAAATAPPTPPPEFSVTAEWSKGSLPSQLGTFAQTETSPLVAVIGVGYVGTHLVEAFAHHYTVIAFDVNQQRLSYVADKLKGQPIRFTSCAANLAEASHFLISVPTLLNPDKSIDTTYLQDAIANVEKYAKPGSTVIVESSVAVGMTRQLVGPLLASKNFKVGMSPERVDPGRSLPAFEDIPKVVSGLDGPSLESICRLYNRVFKTLVPVSSPEVAEMTKLYENCQRMVCAAYVNEMADACNALGIDAWEVSQAAASKPFGYLPFMPGPGIGGHCIPVNPYYLLSTCAMPILHHATETSWRRPAIIASRLMEALIWKNDQSSSGSPEMRCLRILVVGVGFKRGQGVLSNSPGAAIITALLSDWDVYVEFADPLVSADALSYVPKMNTDADWNEAYLGAFDGVVVAVDQVGLDMAVLDRLQQSVTVHNYSGNRRHIFSKELIGAHTLDVGKPC